MADKIKINDSDELDIECLLADIPICPYRARLNWHFGRKIKIECPHRLTLKREFEKWKAAKTNKKFDDEYPDG
jgi:hypothetical protein